MVRHFHVLHFQSTRKEVGPGAHKSCHISEMVQDRAEFTITD